MVLPGLSAAPLLLGGTKFIAPPGEFIRTAPASFNWTVPDGVYSISAVCIGAGGGSGGGSQAGAAGGGAGALVYSNNIPVTPGEILTIEAGAGGVAGTYIPGTAGGRGGNARILRGVTVLMSAEGGYGGPSRNTSASQSGGSGGWASLSVGDVKFNGGAGADALEAGTSLRNGGAVSNYTANGLAGSTALTSLYGTLGPFNANWGRGANGRAAFNSAGIAASNGAVRIIWGADFSYPDNAVIP